MDGTSVAEIVAAVRASWSAATTTSWDEASPASGHCAVTALIVQDFLGGDLLRGSVDGVSHYWNLLPEGEIDLTREQFPRFELDDVPTIRDRAYVMSFPGTVARYTVLADRVARALGARTDLGQEGTDGAGPHDDVPRRGDARVV